MDIIFNTIDKFKELEFKKAFQKLDINLISEELRLDLEIKGFNAIIIDFCDINNQDTVSELYVKILNIRKKNLIPLFVILETSNSADRQVLLELGATALFNSKVDLEELVLSVKNILLVCNTNKMLLGDKNIEKKIDLISKNRTILLGDGSELQLTRNEYKVLYHLKASSGNVASYEEISKAVWRNKNELDGKTRISNIVCHIRKKLKKANLNPNFIQTVRGVGYRIYIDKSINT